MSPASHMVGRLRKPYGILLSGMRTLNEQQSRSPCGHSEPARRCFVEQLEPRLLLSSAAGPHGLFLEEQFRVDGQPFSLAVLDLNGDGALDVVATSADEWSGDSSPHHTRESGSISVLLGAGRGTFADPIVYPLGNGPAPVAIADLNNDGAPDMVTGGAQDGRVTVFLGRGDGTFIEQTVATVPDSLWSVALGDLNEDGLSDLVAATASGNALVFLGTGNGALAEPVSYAVGENPVSVAVLDVNRDGHLDVLVGDAKDRLLEGSVSVFLGRGDGTFSGQSTLDVPTGLTSMTVADLNSDGVPDVVTAGTRPGDNLSVFTGCGDGTFRLRRTYALEDWPSSAAAGDVNGDGATDIVAISVGFPQNLVQVFLGSGYGTFANPSVLPPMYADPIALALADVNGDGDLDIVTAMAPPGAEACHVSVLLNNGAGTFPTPGPTYPTYFPDHVPCHVVLADIDRDGILDLVTASRYSSYVTVRMGRGDGGFGSLAEYATAGQCRGLAVGDLNSDGMLDIVTGNYGGRLSVLLGVPAGGFLYEGYFPVGSRVADLVLSDLNRDSALDAVITDYWEDTVSVLLGNGNGGFASRVSYPVGTWPTSVAVGDVNEDGALDLVTTNGDNYGEDTEDDTLSLLHGRGDGTFDPAVALPVAGDPLRVALADLNRDGHLDVATATCWQTFDSEGYPLLQGDLSVMLGNGDSTFAPESRYPLHGGPILLALVDLNGDGFLDAVTVPSWDMLELSTGCSRVSVLSGAADGTFGGEALFTTGDSIAGLAAGDLDGDGVPDLVFAAEEWDTSVSTLINRGAVDLEVTAVAAVRPRYSGDPLGVYFAVRNTQKRHLDGSWADAIYLSQDEVFDPATDLLLDWVPHTGHLVPGDIYTVNVRVPAQDEGTYYFFVRADAGDAVFEPFGGENNNLGISAAFTLERRPPGQLVPAEATPDNSAYDVGDTLGIRYVLTNACDDDIACSWSDGVYLSADDHWDSEDVLLGRLEHTAGLVAGGSMPVNASFTVPPMAGVYRVLLRTDLWNQIAEGPSGELDNVTATGLVNVNAIPLTAGVGYSGTLTSARRAMLFRLDVAEAGAEIGFLLESAQGINELYASYESVPTRDQFDYRYDDPSSAHQLVKIASARAGSYYVLAYAEALAGAANAFTLTATLHDEPLITGISPESATSGDVVTFLVKGYRLDLAVSYTLHGPEQVVVPPSSVQLTSGGDALVTFDLVGAPEGDYSLIAETAGQRQFDSVGWVQADGGTGGLPWEDQAAMGPIRVMVMAAYESIWDLFGQWGSKLEVKISGPRVVRTGRDFDVEVHYHNTGSADMVAPLFIINGPEEVVLSIPGGTDSGCGLASTPGCGTLAYRHPGVLRCEASGSFVVHVDVPTRASTDSYQFCLNVALANPTVPVNDHARGWTLESSDLVVDPRPGGPVVTLWTYRDGEWQIAEGTASLDPSRYTEVIVHGWNNGTVVGHPRDDFRQALNDEDNALWMRRMGERILAYSSDQVVLVDAGPYLRTGTGLHYLEASANVAAAATSLAEALQAQGFSNEMTASNIHFIGHSLGAHVAAEAARQMGHVDHVTGLDSARGCPLYGDSYLRPDCATYVDHYRSSPLGRPIQERLGHESFDVQLPIDMREVTAQHGYVLEWYLRTIDGIDTGYGFDHNACEGHSAGWTGIIYENGAVLDWTAQAWDRTEAVTEIPVVYSELLTVQVVGSYDPNDKTGPAGFGPEGFISAAAPMPFKVEFENLPAASAPAQEVWVTDQLDPDLDWASVELDEIAFAHHLIAVPAGLNHFRARVDLRPDGKNLLVDVTADVDVHAGLMTLHLICSNPDTGVFPEDPLEGFLPPNNPATHCGEGHLTYIAQLRPGLATGTVISNRASIVFDYNDPIETPTTINTIDAAAPTSQVEPLPPVTANLEFPVSWSGEDETGGSGFANYDVYASDNAGEYRPWLAATTATSATFAGEDGHTYAFYTVARDNVGHIEAVPAGPDASTIVRTLPRIVGVELNDRPGRSVSTIDPSGVGIRTVKVTFSEPATFDASDVVVQTVEFEGKTETVTATLMPASMAGTGTNVMTLTLDSTVVADTWVKVTLKASGIADLAANALDGEARPAGSGRHYIFSPTLDLPTGDGNPGGDAVFYVGSLRGDFSGDGVIGADDVDAFLAKFLAGNMDADFCGSGFGASPPNGQVTPADIDAFISTYNAAVSEGHQLDPLPDFGPQGEGAPEPVPTAFSPEVLSGSPAPVLEPTAPLAPGGSPPATLALGKCPTPLLGETGILVAAPQAASSEGSAFLASRGTSEADDPPLLLLTPAGTPLAWSTAEEVAPPPDPILLPDGGVEDLLLLPALEVPTR